MTQRILTRHARSTSSFHEAATRSITPADDDIAILVPGSRGEARHPGLSIVKSGEESLPLCRPRPIRPVHG
ncbi:hypothetical protein [Methylobacterium sp. SyP6R]|uniref:hypothetical protein n=1 Tax=Methylobacterium sp. SyP6R TaxID=2718876 RepID=UPI001F3E3389|nr:hypothetical protein [Methylobacterium sp. SyP6R]MCF4128963.1 hypothetical protein [Methylobacterium sp. SyP6R]